MQWPESPFALIARGVFSGLCHQDPDRSFLRDGHAMAVCHRCTGIYLGLELGALAALGLRPDASRKSYWLAGVAPLALQVALGWVFPALDLYWLRVATGLVAGGAGGLLLASAVAGPRKV